MGEKPAWHEKIKKQILGLNLKKNKKQEHLFFELVTTFVKQTRCSAAVGLQQGRASRASQANHGAPGAPQKAAKWKKALEGSFCNSN